MSYRQVYIRKAEKLSLRHNSLIIKKEQEEIAIPLEDIASLLLEDQQTVITATLLSALSEYYITLIICDEKHLPVTQTMPINMHYKQLKVFYNQLNVKKPLNSQLWNRLIYYKILNQKAVIDFTVKNEDASLKMKQCLKELQSGDKTNREAVAARVFFDAMYGNAFSRKRKSEDAVNAALNYGYSIIAGQVTRVLTMYGFNTNIGIHHESMNNSFNLSYDFVEPYRPVVDLYVYKNINEFDTPLPLAIRKELVELLQYKVKMNDKYYNLQFAIEETIKSYIQCLENENSSLLCLPELSITEEVNDDDKVEL